MKRHKLEVSVVFSQVPQDFLTRVKLGSISVHIFLINLISDQHQFLSSAKLDDFSNVLIRQNLTWKYSIDIIAEIFTSLWGRLKRFVLSAPQTPKIVFVFTSEYHIRHKNALKLSNGKEFDDVF